MLLDCVVPFSNFGSSSFKTRLVVTWSGLPKVDLPIVLFIDSQALTDVGVDVDTGFVVLLLASKESQDGNVEFRTQL